METGEESDIEFRSFGLLGHPLGNANVVSLFLGFILVNKRLKHHTKIFLILLGFAGLWGFNSRAAILVWIIILIYRLTLYNTKLWKVIFGSISLIILWPLISEWLNSGILGRFSLDFSDSSSMARLDSYAFFAMYDWNWSEIISGGLLLEMPGTGLLLENGFLLNLSYWGWIVGAFKMILEFLITLNLLKRYNKREIFIVLLAFWGCGMSNNILRGTFIFIYFLFAYSGFYNNDHFHQSVKSRNRYNKENILLPN